METYDQPQLNFSKWNNAVRIIGVFPFFRWIWVIVENNSILFVFFFLHY